MRIMPILNKIINTSQKVKPKDETLAFLEQFSNVRLEEVQVPRRHSLYRGYKTMYVIKKD